MNDIQENDIINQKILSRENEYVNYTPLKIFCGTFNVAAQSPDECLEPWLKIKNEDKIDIYAIGFQEIVDLTTTSLVFQQNWEEKEFHWTSYVNEILSNARHFKLKYKQIQRVRMFGLYLLIYADEKLFEKGITDIFTSYVATGLLNMGNKGSVSVSLKIYETRICFVCSHFAANTDQVEKRNSDFRNAKKNLRFQEDKIDLSQHDIIFWFGDLNYRLDMLSLNDTIKLIDNNSFEELLKYDQLLNERKSNRVFDSYSEGKIEFKPTYKYSRKSDLYEKQTHILQNGQTSENDDVVKTKLPSWTDRVLWKSREKIELIQYSSINTITISDHKPVFALFSTQFKKIDEAKLTKCIEKIQKETDRKLNTEMPRIVVEKKEFHFGECMFYDVKTQLLKIKNDGLAKCSVEILFHDSELKEQQQDKLLFRMQRPQIKTKSINQWINIFPQYVEKLAPNTSCIIELTTCFSQMNSSKLNKLKDIENFLIIKCVNGNDLFVSVNCIYKPTIMGISIKALSTIKSTESFDLCDQDNLFNKIESDIHDHENHVDLCLTSNLIRSTRSIQIDKAYEFLGPSIDMKTLRKPLNLSVDYTQALSNTLQQSDAVSMAKVEIFLKSLTITEQIIVENDQLFNNDLSEEYKFLMQHLINRCENNLNMINGLIDENNSNENITIEEQKNLIIYYLSNRNFTEIERLNFDLELFAQVLNDLLIALPQPLIPFRYNDYCLFTDSVYDEAIKLFKFIPKSNFKLFEMIVKFLQVYLSFSSSTNYHNVLADAIFQVNSKQSKYIKTSNNVPSKFLKLFIENHKLFQTI